jgi:hypothetical protein
VQVVTVLVDFAMHDVEPHIGGCMAEAELALLKTPGGLNISESVAAILVGFCGFLTKIIQIQMFGSSSGLCDISPWLKSINLKFRYPSVTQMILSHCNTLTMRVAVVLKVPREAIDKFKQPLTRADNLSEAATLNMEMK